MKEASAYDDLIYKLVFLDSDEDKEKVYRLINHVIRETWDDALDKAAENAKLEYASNYGIYDEQTAQFKEYYKDVVLNTHTGHGDYGYNATRVSKQSILKLKL